MEVIISTVSNADLAEQAVVRAGGTPLFVCCQSPRDARTERPIKFIPDPDAYYSALAQLLDDRAGNLVFFSTSASDKTQECDRGFRDLVVARGARFIGQSDRAINTSLSKLMSKDLARRVGMNIPSELTQQADAHYVVKRVFGDSGHGQRILSGYELSGCAPNGALGDEFFVERFIAGVEISASVFRTGQVLYMGPLIVKGLTGTENLHSVDKVRAVYPGRFVEMERYLAPLCKALSDELQSEGWLDIEFIVSEEAVYFLEVNARFSGLSRLFYTATGINPYEVALTGGSPASIAPDERFAMELPLVRDADFFESTNEVSVNRYPNPGRTLGKCTFSALSVDELYAKCGRLEPSPLNGEAVAIAEEAAKRLERLSSNLTARSGMGSFTT